MNNSIVPVSVCLRWLHLFLPKQSNSDLVFQECRVSSTPTWYISEVQGCYTAPRSWIFQSSCLVIQFAHARRFGSTVLFSYFARVLCSFARLFPGCSSTCHFLLIIARRCEFPDGNIIGVVVEGFHWTSSHIETGSFSWLASWCTTLLVLNPSVAC